MLIEELLSIIDVCENSELDFFQFKSHEGEVSFHKPQNVETLGGLKNDYNIVVNRKETKNEISHGDDPVVVSSPHVGIIHLKEFLTDDLENNIIMVRQGDPLCTIEAMKLYNNVICPVDGKVTEIMVKDGQEVEYGQPILKIGVSLTST